MANRIDYVGQTAWIRDRDGANVAFVCNPNQAPLYAAAPEMLAALEYWFNSKADPKTLAVMARAAIARATGKGA